MKTKILIFLTMCFLATTIGCGKYDAYERAKDARDGVYSNRLGQKTGALIVSTEEYIDRHRSGFTLEECARLAEERTVLVEQSLYEELIRELKNIIRILSLEYRTQRDEKTDEESIAKRKKYLWNKVAGGNENALDPELIRVCDYYPHHLVAVVKDYILDDLLFGGGTREDDSDNPVNPTEVGIQNMFTDTIRWDYPPEYIVRYRDEIYWYFYFYAVDPAHYRDAKKAGLPTPSLTQMRELYPEEKLQSFDNLDEFREWSLTQADYMQPNAKPVEMQEMQKE